MPANMDAATHSASAPPVDDIAVDIVYADDAADDEVAHDQTMNSLVVSTAIGSLLSANLPPGVFPFEQLPLELQFEIWEYAIDMENDVPLDHSIFLRARHHHYRNVITFPTAYAGFIKSASQVWNLGLKRQQYAVRFTMMGVCRLSRKYALQEWLKELEGIVVPLDCTTATDRFWLSSSRPEILGMLDARIKGLVRRMKGQF